LTTDKLLYHRLLNLRQQLLRLLNFCRGGLAVGCKIAQGGARVFTRGCGNNNFYERRRAW
jgi:hypothetical protein